MTTIMRTDKRRGIKQQGLIEIPYNTPVVTAAMITGNEFDEGSVYLPGESPIPKRPIERDLEPVSMRTLYLTQDLYELPEYQRDFVWSYAEAAHLVLMMLWNFDCGIIQCFQHQREDGSFVKSIAEGQQRFTSALYFMENMFPLPTPEQEQKYYPNSRIPVIEKGCYFKYDPKYPKRPVISPELRSRFEDFRISISTMRYAPVSWEPDYFETCQNGHRLKPGNRLWARRSAMNVLIKRFEMHPFWHEVYETRKKRDDEGNITFDPMHTPKKNGKVWDPGKVRFTAALQTYVLECLPPPHYKTMRMNTLMEWASGIYDKGFATPEYYQRVWDGMSGMAVIFKGAAATSRTDMILMKQAELLLRDEFDLVHSEPGCAVEWFQNIKRVREYTLANGETSLFSISAHMRDLWAQEIVWNEQTPVLKMLPGLVREEDVTEEWLAERATS